MRTWDEFYGGPNLSSDKRLHVSLNRKGVLLLNRKAYEKIGAPKAAVLLFDRRNSTIGVRPAPPDTQHAFPFKLKPCEIRAMPFCRHHKIKIPRTISFPNPEVDPDGTLLLNLHSAIEVGRSL